MFRGLFWSALVLTGFHGVATANADVESEDKVKAALFTKVFGELAFFPPEIVAEVLALPTGERLHRDTNGDGEPNEVWFVDPSTRHPESYRPVLVRAIDQDGDMGWGGFPDHDSDLYLASWNATGRVDAVLEYVDRTGDNQVDEMGVFYYGSSHSYFDEPVLRVWWGRDDGGDNLLWYDIAYTYDQWLCEDRTHFGGDETFVAFALPLSGDRWVPFFENPFLFYDLSGNGATDEVLRLSGIGPYVESFRHSFDADRNNSLESPREFDVGVSAWAPGSRHDTDGRPGISQTLIPVEYTETTEIRGIPTDPFLSRSRAREFVADVTWARMMLAWDEVDQNIDRQRFIGSYERWEGIISAGNDFFPQVGGPHSGITNRRFEVAESPTAPIQVYFHPVDGRIHLHEATQSWLIVDPSFDDEPLFRYDLLDTNGDGFVDTWTLDVDMDGQPDDRWEAARNMRPGLMGYTWIEIGDVMEEVLDLGIPLLENLERRTTALVRSLPNAEQPPLVGVEEIFLAHLPRLAPEFQKRFSESRSYWRYALQSSFEYQVAYLKKAADVPVDWTEFESVRSTGDYERLSTILQRACVQKGLQAEAFVWPDLNTGRLSRTVAYNDNWSSPNVAWESEKAANRFYWGQIDPFGKRRDSLITPALGESNYHVEQDWGMDILLVGSTGGLGGVGLMVDGEYFPVRTPGGAGSITFEHRIEEISDKHLRIHVTASNVGPPATPFEINYVIEAIGGERFSPIAVTVEGGPENADVEVLLEMTKLESGEILFDQAAGVLASWGRQALEIGWIGLAVLFPDAVDVEYREIENAHAVAIPARVGVPVRYAIMSDWQNGHRFSRSPSANDWFTTLRVTTARIRDRHSTSQELPR